MIENQIICGNSLEVLKTFPDGCVNLVFTSPPYNVGIEYDNWNDNLELENYLLIMENIFTECIRILSPGGHLAIQIGNTGRQPYTPLTGLFENFLYKKIKMRGEIIWDKQNMTSATAWGSWLSPNSPSLRDCHEYILIFRKDGDRKGESDIKDTEFLEFTKSIWKVKAETQNIFNHPAPFSEELAARIIKLYSFKNEIVLDPFCGSGTTCKVAKMLGRKYIGVDISENYCSMANNRLAQQTLI